MSCWNCCWLMQIADALFVQPHWRQTAVTCRFVSHERKLKIIVRRIIPVNVQVDSFLSVNIHSYSFCILCCWLTDELVRPASILFVKDNISLLNFVCLVVAVAVVECIQHFHAGRQSFINNFPVDNFYSLLQRCPVLPLLCRQFVWAAECLLIGRCCCRFAYCLVVAVCV